MGVPDVAQSAAAVPAACPMLMHVPMTRAEPCASRVAERQRPATSMLRRPRGTRQPNGNVVGAAVLDHLAAMDAAGAVHVELVRAFGDAVGALAAGQHVFAGQHLDAHDAARLADADARREAGEDGAPRSRGHASAGTARRSRPGRRASAARG